MVKFSIDYNEATEKPEIVLEINTNGKGLDEKMVRRFLELAENITTQKVVVSKEVVSASTVIRLKCEPA